MEDEALFKLADAHRLHSRAHRRRAHRDSKVNLPFLNGMPKIRATAIDQLNSHTRTSLLIRIQLRYNLRVESAAHKPATQCPTMLALSNITEAYLWSEDNSAELERGWIKKADTLEGLAELVGIDPEGLASEVERFNGFAQAGQDDDFGRASMAPLGEGPYYAIEQGVSIIYSISGVRADEKARVLDWDGNPIPRLYSAGNIGQGVYLIPIGIQGCWAEGRFAARDAIALEPRT